MHAAPILALALLATPDFALHREQITFGPKHHFFGYIGHALTISWDAGGRYILSLRTDFYRRMPAKGEAAEIVLIDTQDNYKVIPVDRTSAWNLQQGTMMYWNPASPRPQFFFNDMDPDDGTVFTVLVDVGQRKRLREFRFGNQSVANGGVSPSGHAFAGINYGKVSRCRKVISYSGASDWTAGGVANPADDGLFVIDSNSGERKLIVSCKKLAEFLNVTDPAYPVYVHHTLWNRDGDRIFFIVRGPGRGFAPNAGCVIRPDGTGLKTIAFAGHPEWGEGKQLVLPDEAGYFKVFDVDAAKDTGKIGSEGVFPNTREDNVLSPDAKWYVGAHNPDMATCVYTWYRLSDGAYVRSAPLRTWRNGGDCRIDPAPLWNRTSDAILVSGIADDDTRQLYIIRRLSGAGQPGKSGN